MHVAPNPHTRIRTVSLSTNCIAWKKERKILFCLKNWQEVIQCSDNTGLNNRSAVYLFILFSYFFLRSVSLLCHIKWFKPAILVKVQKLFAIHECLLFSVSHSIDLFIHAFLFQECVGATEKQKETFFSVSNWFKAVQNYYLLTFNMVIILVRLDRMLKMPDL